jgi:hypothetical protein
LKYPKGGEMGLKEIFSDSIRYPFADVSKFVILGFFALIAAMSTILTDYTLDGAIMAVAGVISFIAGLLISGYGVSVVKAAIEKSDDVPAISLVANIVDGVKVLVITLIYYAIPTIAVIVMAILSTMGLWVDENVFLGLGLTVIAVAIVLYLLFAVMADVAVARFAKTGEFSDALALREVFRDIRRIGIFKIIAFVVVLFIIIAAVAAVMVLIGFIPYVGVVISSFVGGAYLIFLTNRAFGLLYADS